VNRHDSAPSLSAEAQRLQGMRRIDPYDRATCENLAEVLFDIYREQHPMGTLARGRHLLEIIGLSFPTPRLTAAYFENLERMLEGKQRRSVPGRIILGLGTGRCGSSTLTAILATIQGSCCTHENPPLINWNPLEDQVRFHAARLELLAGFFSLVFDASHWWLNAIGELFSRFPQAKAIGLWRDVEPCVQSFMTVKGFGWGSINHWVAPSNRIWCSNFYDPTYPIYPIPEISETNPDAGKRAVLARYVRDYNDQLQKLAARAPEKILLIRTDNLSQTTVQERIFTFVGLRGEPSKIVLNAGKVGDGGWAGPYKF